MSGTPIRRIPLEVLSIFDPFGNAEPHRALDFDVLGEDVLITGAGPIGIMATAMAKHAGTRDVVTTDLNPYRLELAKKMGATVALNVNERRIADVQRELGMTEGFDVGLEMSGNGEAFKEMLANMCHGAKIALLGLPFADLAIDWNTVIFKMLTIKGIYGREMYETWYLMQSMIQTGLDISPVITHRFHYTEFQQAFEVMGSGIRAGDPELGGIRAKMTAFTEADIRAGATGQSFERGASYYHSGADPASCGVATC